MSIAGYILQFPCDREITTGQNRQYKADARRCIVYPAARKYMTVRRHYVVAILRSIKKNAIKHRMKNIICRTTGYRLNVFRQRIRYRYNCRLRKILIKHFRQRQHLNVQASHPIYYNLPAIPQNGNI